jgi:ABC transporter substrate binding protein
MRRAQDIAPAFDALKNREVPFIFLLTRFNHEPGSHQHIGARRATADDIQHARVGRSGGSDVLWAELATCGVKILRGVTPAEIPVEQPTKFSLGVNVTAVKALGLTIPPTILVRPDEVVEWPRQSCPVSLRSAKTESFTRRPRHGAKFVQRLNWYAEASHQGGHQHQRCVESCASC